MADNSSLKAKLTSLGGYVFFLIGLAGAFLPILPTTIFWIIAAWLFAKSHPAMMHKIYGWPRIGVVVEDFLERGVIARRSKIIALLGIGGVGGFSIWLTGLERSWLIASVAILIMAGLFVLTRASPDPD